MIASPGIKKLERSLMVFFYSFKTDFVKTSLTGTNKNNHTQSLIVVYPIFWHYYFSMRLVYLLWYSVVHILAHSLWVHFSAGFRYSVIKQPGDKNGAQIYKRNIKHTSYFLKFALVPHGGYFPWSPLHKDGLVLDHFRRSQFLLEHLKRLSGYIGQSSDDSKRGK